MARVLAPTITMEPGDEPKVQHLGPYLFVYCSDALGQPSLQFRNIDAAEKWADSFLHQITLRKQQLRFSLRDEDSDAVIYGGVEGSAA